MDPICVHETASREPRTDVDTVCVHEICIGFGGDVDSIRVRVTASPGEAPWGETFTLYVTCAGTSALYVTCAGTSDLYMTCAAASTFYVTSAGAFTL